MCLLQGHRECLWNNSCLEKVNYDVRSGDVFTQFYSVFRTGENPTRKRSTAHGTTLGTTMDMMVGGTWYNGTTMVL